MPLRPRFRPGSLPASKQFTDRDSFVEAFDGALDRFDPRDHETYHVLVYYGVGGIGKTALRQFLGRRLDTGTEVKWAVVDFDAPTNRTPEHALFVMRNELKRNYGFRFPTFDLAYAVYWERTHPQTALTRADLPGLDEGDVLLEVLLAVEDVPGLGLLTKIPKALAKIGGRALDWWRGQANDLRALTTLEPHEILERLSMFWAIDLQQALEVTGEKVVLFLDTYEALWDGKRVEHLRFSVDRWVREWVLQLPGVLWVFGGREKLAWAELDADWSDALDQHLLGALSDDDARRFLRAAGISETTVQDIILESAEGVPLYLDLAVDTHQQLTHLGRVPVAADFARTPREVLDRFLRYLDRSERETLNVLSAARRWDAALFEQLITAFQTGYPPTALPDLCRFSFIEDIQTDEETDEPEWTMHPLMREGLQTHGDPALSARVHRFLFDYYDTTLQDLSPGALTDAHRRALHEAFHHARVALPPESFVTWFHQTDDPFEQAAQWSLLVPLQEQLAAFAETTFGSEDVRSLSVLNNLANLYKDLGRFDDAEPLYRQCLAIGEEAVDLDRPRIATFLNNLAMLYVRQARYEDAETLYRRGLAIEEKHLGPDHPNTATLIDNWAHLKELQGQYEDAESLYRRGLSIREANDPEHLDTARSLNNLAVLYDTMGRHEEAEALYRRSLALREALLGDDHPQIATSLNNLAALLLLQDQYDEAERLLTRCLQIREQTLGAAHPDVGVALVNLAQLYTRQGRFQEAEPLLRRSLRLLEDVWGPAHPQVATTLNNLGALYQAQGRYDEARPYVERSLTIREAHLGTDHPLVAASLNNLAVLYKAAGRYDEAEPLFQRSLRILHARVAPDHLDLASALHNLATLYDGQGRTAEAASHYLQCLNILVRRLGAEDPRTRAVHSAYDAMRRRAVDDTEN